MSAGSDMWLHPAMSLARTGMSLTFPTCLAPQLEYLKCRRPHPPPTSLHVIAHHSEVQPKHLCTVTESQAEESRGFKASQSHGSEDPEYHFHWILSAKVSHMASPDPRGEESPLLNGRSGRYGWNYGQSYLETLYHNPSFGPNSSHIHAHTQTCKRHFLPPDYHSV